MQLGGGSLRYQVHELEEVVGNLRLRLECIADLNQAIDAMFSELESLGSPALLEELCPYFGTVWPSARILARWIQARGETAFRDKTVLELGCGLALPSFAAAALGARVTATDSHPDVEAFLHRNLQLNPGTSIAYRQEDWRDPVVKAERFDWIIGSDILYEKYQAAALIGFLKTTLARGGKAVFLDPNRSYWERLVIFGRHAGFTVRTENLESLSHSEPKEPVLLTVYHRSED